MPIIAPVKEPKMVEVGGEQIPLYVSGKRSDEDLERMAVAEYKRKKAGSTQQSYKPEFQYPEPSRIAMPFQYPEGDTTPLPQKALGYGLDVLNAATLPFAPEAIAAGGLGRLAAGVITGTAGGLGATAAGAPPEVAGLAGAITGGATALSPKASGGITGAVKGAAMAPINHPRTFAYRAALAPILHYLGVPNPAASGIPAAIAFGSEGYEGMRAGAAGKKWIDPVLGKIFGMDRPIEAEFVGPKPAGPRMIPEKSPLFTNAERVYNQPAGAYNPNPELPGPMGRELPGGAPAPKLLEAGPKFYVAPDGTVVRSPATPVTAQGQTMPTVRVGYRGEDITPKSRAGRVMNPKDAATRPGPETPAHNEPQVNNPPAQPTTPAKSESKTTSTEHQPKADELPAPDAVKSFTGGTEDAPLSYAEMKKAADALGVPTSMLARHLEAKGYKLEPSKLSKSGSYGLTSSKTALNNLLDLLDPSQISKLLGRE